MPCRRSQHCLVRGSEQMGRISIPKIAHRAADRLGAFHEKHSWLGPTIFISSALYFYAQIVVAWVFRPQYSLVFNTISDLGNTTCGHYGTVDVCSPRWWLMDAAFVLLGLVMAGGSLLIYHEFREKDTTQRVAAFYGFLLMAIGGVGVILVGIFPENTISYMHVAGAGLAIGAGNVGIFILGAALSLPEAMRRYMLVFSTVSLTALFLFAFHQYFGIGAGTMERIAAYPETIWLITFGLFIWRFHPKDHSSGYWQSTPDPPDGSS